MLKIIVSLGMARYTKGSKLLQVGLMEPHQAHMIKLLKVSQLDCFLCLDLDQG